MARVIDSWKRWFGLFCLLLALGMLVWGQTWLKPHLQGVVFVLYWIGCLVWTLLALVMALWDLRETRRQARREQVDLFRRAFGEEQQGGKDGGVGKGSSPRRGQSD